MDSLCDMLPGRAGDWILDCRLELNKLGPLPTLVTAAMELLDENDPSITHNVLPFKIILFLINTILFSYLRTLMFVFEWCLFVRYLESRASRHKTSTDQSHWH